LKIKKVSSAIRLTVVTGITRYALTSMDSGPNHLNDISLDPRFAGICGFTLDEFDPLFQDRLPEPLARLKAARLMKPSDDPAELRAEILHWYDGYNWGGPTKVLNPYSILHFFKNNAFGDYWLQSGRPAHLTALIRANPLGFLAPRLESYLSEEVRKTDLTQLQPVPVLFHSGYLTLDEITRTLEENPETKKEEIKETFSFRTPNYEVSQNYNKDLFKLIFNIDPLENLSQKAEELREAILARDTEKTGAFFQDHFFSRITYHERPCDEATFHSFVHLILIALDFKVLSEVPGATGRLDLVFELPGGVHVIVEFKHVPKKTRLTKAEMDQALADKALFSLDFEAINEGLAAAVARRYRDSDQAVKDMLLSPLSFPERNRRLAKEAGRLLSTSQIDSVLADLAKDKLSQEVIDTAVKEKLRELAPSNEEIDKDLLKAANQAIDDIIKRDYNSVIGDMAKEIIDLGLASYGYFKPVKAVFGPGRKRA
jgi:hypothetical protein